MVLLFLTVQEKIVQAFRRRFNYFRRASKQYTSVDERCALKRGQVEKTLDSSKRPCEGKDSVTDNGEMKYFE